MKDNIQSIADEEKGVATCILCGKLLEGYQVVKYRDWYAHAECAQGALERQVDNFNRTPFILGSLGAIFGYVLAAPILLMTEPMLDPTGYIFAFIGMAICLLFQVFGFYGFASNYDEGIGIICSIISVISAVAHLFVASLLFQYGYDPLYHDPETGVLLLMNIPNMELALFLAFGFLLLLMILAAVMVLLLGESVSKGIDNRVIAVIFVASGALMPWTPINFFIEMFLITILFLSAKVPKEWRKIEFE